MKYRIKNLFKILASLMMLTMAKIGYAALPTMEAPSRGNGSGIMETIKNYGYDAVILAGLLVGAFAFTKVASALIQGFGEVTDGKKKWGELGVTALVGVVILIVMIWLLTEAAKIL